MRRGENPYITLNLGCDTGLFEKFRVLVTQGRNVLSFEDDRIERRQDRIRVKFTQEETLCLRDGYVNVEVRALKPNKDAYSSNIVNFKIKTCLDNEVI